MGTNMYDVLTRYIVGRRVVHCKGLGFSLAFAPVDDGAFQFAISIGKGGFFNKKLGTEVVSGRLFRKLTSDRGDESFLAVYKEPANLYSFLRNLLVNAPGGKRIVKRFCGDGGKEFVLFVDYVSGHVRRAREIYNSKSTGE